MKWLEKFEHALCLQEKSYEMTLYDTKETDFFCNKVLLCLDNMESGRDKNEATFWPISSYTVFSIVFHGSVFILGTNLRMNKYSFMRI